MSARKNAEPRASQTWRRATFWAASLPLLAALWLVTRPYPGITHDALLYTAQALAWLDPGRYASDLFFAHGSQDGFTVFSSLYGPLIASAGTSAAHRIGVVLGHILWIGALLALMRAMFPDDREALFGAVGAIILGSAYGALNVFSYGEPFLTPRLFAEAGVMASVAMALTGRWIAGAMLLLAAAACHPVMTLPGIAVAGLLVVRRNPRVWLLVALGGGLALGLAFAGLDPFARVLARLDPDWWAVVRERNAYGVVSAWIWPDWWRILVPACVLAIAWQQAGRESRPLIASVTFVAAAGVLVTFMAGDLGRNVLAVNLQPWRALWLFTLVANAWAAVLATRLPQGSATRHFLLAGLVARVAETWLQLAILASPAVLLIALTSYVWELRFRRPLPRLLRWSGTAAVILAFAFLGLAAWVLVPRFLVARDFVQPALGIAILISVGALLLRVVGRHPPPLRVTLLAGVSLTTLAAAIADRRTAWERFMASSDRPADLLAFVEDAGETYWEAGLPLLWLKLQRPSAWSCLQGAGAMFFPGTALEYDRRSRALASLNTAGDFSNGPPNLCPAREDRGATGPRDPAALALACRRWPELRTIVLTEPVPGLPGRIWRPGVPFESVTADGMPVLRESFHLYRCDDLRS